MFRSLAVRNYRLFAIGNFASITGSWMQLVAQNWLVLRLTGSTALLGLTVALQALPAALLGLLGGAIADRAARRKVLAIVQCAWIALTLVLALLAMTEMLEPWMLLVAAVIAGVINAVESPTAAAFGPELVERDDLPNAIALGSAINAAGRVLGMALAGIVVAIAGTGLVFTVNAASFGAVLVALALIRPQELRATPRVDTDLAVQSDGGHVRAGIVYARRQPIILSTIALACWLSTFGRNFQVTMAAMTDGPLHAGAGGYGLASSAFAIGAFGGALLAARLARPTRLLLVIAGLAAGLLQVVASGAPGLWHFVIVMSPLAAIAVVIDTLSASLTQLFAHDAMRGRVAAILGLATVGGSAVGGPLLGWTADAFGPRAALLFGGAAVLCGCTATAALLRDRRPLAVGPLLEAIRARPVQAAELDEALAA
jgi:MFS family permease